MRHRSKQGDTFALHEVYYTSRRKKDISWTVDARSGHYESADELIADLELMLADAKRFKDKLLDFPLR